MVLELGTHYKKQPRFCVLVLKMYNFQLIKKILNNLVNKQPFSV